MPSGQRKRKPLSDLQRLFAGALACALLAGCGAYNDQTNSGAEYLRRWKVTDASGKILSEGCTQQADPRFPKNVIEVTAAPGSIITYQDNLGAEYVQKQRREQQLPTSDTYWCSSQDIYQDNPPWLPRLDKVQVADADPPATIQTVELVTPHNDPTYGTVAEGFRLVLKVQHAGVLHLGFLGPAELDAGTDAGADAGTKLYSIYAAMTLQ